MTELDLAPWALALGLLALRLVAGLTLAIHGVAKLRSLEGTAGWFQSIGLRPGRLHARLAAMTETGAGIGLALGLITPLWSAAYIGVMTTAGWVGHRKNGFSSARNGWENVFVLASMAAVAALLGPGDWSLDNAVGLTTFFGWGWAAAAVGVGVATSVATLATFYRPPAEEGD